MKKSLYRMTFEVVYYAHVDEYKEAKDVLGEVLEALTDGQLQILDQRLGGVLVQNSDHDLDESWKPTDLAFGSEEPVQDVIASLPERKVWKGWSHD